MKVRRTESHGRADIVQHQRYENGAFLTFARFVSDPGGLDRMLRPSDYDTGCRADGFFDRCIKSWTGIKISIPPDAPPLALERRHQGRYTLAVV